MDDRRADDIKSIFKELSSLNTKRYRIKFLTNQFGIGSTRLAHCLLLREGVVIRVKKRNYEIINKKKLNDMCKYSVDKIRGDLMKYMKEVNKKANKDAKYIGKNAPINILKEANRHE